MKQRCLQLQLARTPARVRDARLRAAELARSPIEGFSAGLVDDSNGETRRNRSCVLH